MNPNTLNLVPDPDPELLSNLDPDPGLCCIINFEEYKNLKMIFEENSKKLEEIFSQLSL